MRWGAPGGHWPGGSAHSLATGTGTACGTGTGSPVFRVAPSGWPGRHQPEDRRRHPRVCPALVGGTEIFPRPTFFEAGANFEGFSCGDFPTFFTNSTQSPERHRREHRLLRSHWHVHALQRSTHQRPASSLVEVASDVNEDLLQVVVRSAPR